MPTAGGPHRPVPRPGAPDPGQAASQAAAWANRFGLTLLAALGFGLLPLPWPWPLLSGAGALVALGLGVVALGRAQRARVRRALVAGLVVGMILAGLLGMATLSQLVLWREYAAYTTCLQQALTTQARTGCQAQLERDLQERLDRVRGVTDGAAG